MKLKIVAVLVSSVALLSVQNSAEARQSSHAGRHHAHGAAHHHRSGHHASGSSHAERALGSSLSGLASWYGPGFQGHRTANGERFNANGLTAAHRSLPLGCHVLVTNRANGRSVVVRINDRGPFGTGKIIDLSRASAHAIGMSGSAAVSLSRL